MSRNILRQQKQASPPAAASLFVSALRIAPWKCRVLKLVKKLCFKFGSPSDSEDPSGRAHWPPCCAVTGLARTAGPGTQH